MNIWKYTLEIKNEQKIMMPIGAKILSIKIQNKLPQIWAFVNENAPVELRSFFIVTGTQLPDDFNNMNFIETCLLYEERVIHIFEKMKNIS
jgi:hypothetical protein